MSFNDKRRRLQRLPLSFAIAGVMSLSAICATAVAGEATPPLINQSLCNDDVKKCKLSAKASNFIPFSSQINADDYSVLSGQWSNGPGISIFESGPYPSSTANQVGDIAIGGMSSASGKVGDASSYATTIGDASNVSAANTAFGRSANANNAAVLSAVALGASSAADRSNAVSIGSTSQTRSIQHLAVGTNATDAINVSQLTPVVISLGATLTNGSITKPVYTVGGATQASAAAAIGKLDSNQNDNTDATASLISRMSAGSLGLTQQSASGAAITVGAGTNGATVDFSAKAGARTLKGISAGDISIMSTEAVNGEQLFATNQLSNINAENVANITNTLSNITTGAAGLVLQNADTQTISVAHNTGGNLVDVTGTDGFRVLTGLAAGNLSISSTGVVNGSQLYSTQLQIDALDMRVTTATGNITAIQDDLAGLTPNIGTGLIYDDGSKSLVTLGGAEGTLLTNLTSGLIATGSKQAINGDQLMQISTELEAQVGDLSDRTSDMESKFADLEQGVADGSVTPGFSGDANGNPITNVGAGIASSDAANVGQMTQMMENAVIQAQSYTDGQATAFNSSLDNTRTEIDQRFNRQNERLDHIGAMSVASTHMAINAAGASTPRGRVAVGAGVQNGKGAAAVGYARPIGERAQLSIGGSFSGPEKQAGVGLSISL